MRINDVLVSGQSQPMSSLLTNLKTLPIPYDSIAPGLQGQAGTVKLSYYAVDGRLKVGSQLCALTVTMAAAPGSTTTTTIAPTTTVVPTTLPHTGSNTSSLLAGGAMIVAFGGALYVAGRRRSIK